MTDVELIRERHAIDTFVSMFGGSYNKLDPNDVDYKVFNADGDLIAYVEVISRYRMMRDAYPLIIDAKKMIKLSDKRLNPMAIWACEDGLIYGNITSMSGEIKYSDDVFMIYYEKQKGLKYLRFKPQVV